MQGLDRHRAAATDDDAGRGYDRSRDEPLLLAGGQPADSPLSRYRLGLRGLRDARLLLHSGCWGPALHEHLLPGAD